LSIENSGIDCHEKVKYGRHITCLSKQKGFIVGKYGTSYLDNRCVFTPPKKLEEGVPALLQVHDRTHICGCGPRASKHKVHVRVKGTAVPSFLLSRAWLCLAELPGLLRSGPSDRVIFQTTPIGDTFPFLFTVVATNLDPSSACSEAHIARAQPP
jgi:hypothetical protein